MTIPISASLVTTVIAGNELSTLWSSFTFFFLARINTGIEPKHTAAYQQITIKAFIAAQLMPIISETHNMEAIGRGLHGIFELVHLRTH